MRRISSSRWFFWPGGRCSPGSGTTIMLWHRPAVEHEVNDGKRSDAPRWGIMGKKVSTMEEGSITHQGKRVGAWQDLRRQMLGHLDQSDSWRDDRHLHSGNGRESAGKWPSRCSRAVRTTIRTDNEPPTASQVSGVQGTEPPKRCGGLHR